MSTCSRARKPRRGTLRALGSGSLSCSSRPQEKPESRWFPASDSALPAPKSVLPPNTHQLEPLYLKRTQAQRGCPVVQPPPLTGPGSGTHRRPVVRTEIPRAVGWREVELGALKWLPLARPR